MQEVTKTSARDLDRSALEDLAQELGAKTFQAKALSNWVFVKGIRSFEAASNLPKALRSALAERLDLQAATLVERSIAEDGTEKMLLCLNDGEQIEMVLIPEASRRTLCMSTQVGCPVGCVFCASGLLGVRRNLTKAEILEQFYIAREELLETPLTNLVVMGIGEPMLNLKSLLPALEEITRTDGIAFSPRRVTVSTSGYPEHIMELAREGRPYQLAISLHTADPILRKKLVPNVQDEPTALVGAAVRYFEMTGREPTFEIVLLEGVNDGPEQAKQLAMLLSRVQCTVNLIPWNPVEELSSRLGSPHPARVDAFRAVLEEAGVNVTLRRKRGSDKNAACGQLRLRPRS